MSNLDRDKSKLQNDLSKLKIESTSNKPSSLEKDLQGKEGSIEDHQNKKDELERDLKSNKRVLNHYQTKQDSFTDIEKKFNDISTQIEKLKKI